MRSKILTVSAAVLALGMTAACGGGGRLERRRRARPARSRCGCRTTPRRSPGARRWSRSGTPPTRREGHRAGDPGRQDLRGGHRRGDHRRQRARAWCSTPARPPCRSSRSRAASSPSTASPAAADYIKARIGRLRRPVHVAGREVLPDPVEANPVMIFYNKDLFKKAGLDPDKPAAGDVRRVPRRPARRSSTAAPPTPRSAPAPTSEFFQSWFDFYPLYAAESGGKQTIENGKATFNDAGRQGRLELLGADVQGRLRPQGGLQR